MISSFSLAYRLKRGMLEIASATPDDILDKYLDPTQTEKLPEDVCFKVAAGKKEYDLIGYYQNWQVFILKNSLMFCLNLSICQTNATLLR